MTKARARCIDCGQPLFTAVRSRQQPGIRCQDCFDVFSEGVEAVLRGEKESARGDQAAAKALRAHARTIAGEKT